MVLQRKLINAHKVVKKVVLGSVTITTFAIIGFLGAGLYIAKNRFSCILETLKSKFIVQANQVNLTDIADKLLRHEGEISVPFKAQITDNPHQCTNTLLLGMGLGVGTAALCLTAYYADCCLKKERRLRSVDSELLTISPQSPRSPQAINTPYRVV